MVASNGRMASRVGKVIATLALTIAIFVGTSAVNTPRAEAHTLACGWPRCTLYLNRSETYQYAFWGVLPGAPSGMLGAIWSMTALGLRLFAVQYYNRGMCVGFNLSAVPWESQSLFGYRCRH